MCGLRCQCAWPLVLERLGEKSQYGELVTSIVREEALSSNSVTNKH